jgi:hypothetical protein
MTNIAAFLSQFEESTIFLREGYLLAQHSKFVHRLLIFAKKGGNRASNSERSAFAFSLWHRQTQRPGEKTGPTTALVLQAKKFADDASLGCAVKDLGFESSSSTGGLNLRMCDAVSNSVCATDSCDIRGLFEEATCKVISLKDRNQYGMMC